jgi:hypothetical protein
MNVSYSQSTQIYQSNHQAIQQVSEEKSGIVCYKYLYVKT